MCYVIPFTLPCCRRTYVSVTKMKDCPADWPKTKCPKELCFQIGSQPDDRDEGTCWRCKAAEAGIVPENRESLRPGIDSADVERFIVTPDERRSQMEEDGFCWFCGHRCECELCEPVKIDGFDESLLRRSRPPPVEEKRPVNKRLKVEHAGGRQKSNPSFPKIKPKPKARPQTRSTAKSASRGPSNSQFLSPPDQLRHRDFSPSEDQNQEPAFKPEVKYAGYGDQSHIFDHRINGMYRFASLDQGQIHSGFGDQSQIRDPRLPELPSVAKQIHHSYGESQFPESRHVADVHLTPTRQIHNLNWYSVNDASPSRPQYAYPHTHILEPQILGSSQGTASKLTQEPQQYAQPHVLDPRLAISPLRSQLYLQTQDIDPALFNLNKASPSKTAQSYSETYHQQTMHSPSYERLCEQPLGEFKVSSTYSILCEIKIDVRTAGLRCSESPQRHHTKQHIGCL